MLNADSLISLLEVNIKCVAVAEHFCAFFCILWMLLWGGVAHRHFIFCQLMKELTKEEKSRGEKRNSWKVRAVNWTHKHQGRDFIICFSLMLMGQCAGYYLWSWYTLNKLIYFEQVSSKKKKNLVSANAVILFFIAPRLHDAYNSKDSVTETILHKSFVFTVKNEICMQAMHAELVSQNDVCKLFLYTSL